jgi:2-haloacid dehalogenase
MTVRAVVFDVGNVLYHWDMRVLFAKLIHDVSELDWFMANVVTEEWHFQHDAGRPLAEMVAELIAQYPAYANHINAYASRFIETIPGPVAGSLELVSALAARKIPIFGITNFGAEFWDQFRPIAPVFDHFTDIVVSGVEKIVKPDPAIYALALRRFNLAPDEAIFVDDRLENIESAEANGFIGHHFRDAETLGKRLASLGLLGSASL